MIYSRAKLKEVCKIGDGAHASLKRQKSGVLYLTAKNITESGINLSNVDYISEEIYNKHFSKKSDALTCPQKNDILYSIIGSIGGVYIVGDEKVGISSSVAIFRCVEEIVMPQYLYYYIKSPSFHDSIQLVKGGVAQGFMSLSKLGDVEVVYPEDINVQIKIADILSAYDALIENNQKQIKLLEEAAMRLYKEWFVYLRFPGYENTPIVDGVPEGWKAHRFSEKVDIMSGGTPKTTVKSYYGGAIPFYSPKDADGSFFALDSITHITEKGLENCNSKLYPANTVIITARGTVGKITLLAVPMAMNQSCYALKCDELNAPYYLFFALSEEVKKLKAMANGGVFDTIIVKTFDNISLTMPEDGLLRKFEEITSPIMEQIERKMKHIVLLRQARDKLLPKLMSGEIEV